MELKTPIADSLPAAPERPTARVIAYTRFLGVPPELADHGVREDQDQGTELARLVECSGRVCYDSYGKGRDSAAYHEHILEVGHGSVIEHASIGFYLTMSRGCCYDDQTEVLTQEGWKLFKDCDLESDEFLTLNPETEELEYQKATSRFDEPYVGMMYHVKNRRIDLLVTPNHRMYVKRHDTQAAERGEEPWRVFTAEEICGKRVHYRKNAPVRLDPASAEGVVVDIPAVAGPYGPNGTHKVLAGHSFPAREFVRFLGYWLAAGHLSHTKGMGYGIGLTQNEGPTLCRMLQTVEDLGYHPSLKATSGPSGCRMVLFFDLVLYKWLERLGNALDKHVPLELKQLPPIVLKELVDAHIECDGNTHREHGHQVSYTVSKRLADDLQELALKIGSSACVRLDRRIGESHLLPDGKEIPTRRVSYLVSYSQPMSQEPLVNHNKRQSDSWVHYQGRIYCVSVPNGLLYIRRNGVPVWCGNSHEWVRHRAGVAVSQRSTRFVSEETSPWLWHPLVLDALRADEALEGELQELIAHARGVYGKLAKRIEERLTERGLDKLAARKQGRGAARGALGNALQTEMVWTANIRALRHVLEMRASEYADAEIRLLANAVYEAALPVCPEYLSDYDKVDAPDGIGYCLTARHPKV